MLTTTPQLATRKPRAIIFDDDSSIRDVLTRFFVMRKFEVLAFGDPAPVCAVGGKGVDMCQDSNACCDILITDINMPGADGVELLEQQELKGCRLDRRNKAVITGYPDEQNRRRVQSLGCSFFKKPFTLSVLSEWLAGCEQRLDLNRPLSTRRREDRFENCRAITFVDAAGDDPKNGVALNVSPAGLCLKVSTPLRREQTIRVQGSHFPSTREASVRWVRQIEKDAFLVGLHCD